MLYKRMLAKPEVTLFQHTKAVMDACRLLLRTTAGQQLAAMRLDESWKERFFRLLKIAAFLHDWGKISSHFQYMLQTDSSVPQAIRHEAVSYLMLREKRFKDWLAPLFRDEFEWKIVLWAVGSHHRQFPPEECREGSLPKLTIHWTHPDFVEVLKYGEHVFELGPPPQFKKDITFKTEGGNNDVISLFKPIFLKDGAKDLTDEQNRFVALMKLALLCGDVLGSIQNELPDKEIDNYINGSIGRTFAVEMADTIIQAKLQGRELNPIQQQAGKNPERVSLVTTGCGSGKSIYAYAWAKERATGRKLFFAYPTMGTATQGYDDYLILPELNATVVHSSASYDLARLRKHKRLVDDKTPEEDQAIQNSLRLWHTEATTCTVDTILGIVQNQHLGMLSWPIYANGAFIFDEIHCYPESLFQTLLTFLKEFDVPCLLMTATLPKEKLDRIEEVLAQRNEILGKPSSFGDHEHYKRYQQAKVVNGDIHELVQLSKKVLDKGGKVLWVMNKVDRAVDIYKLFSGYGAICYHSRFKYPHRHARHQELVKRFAEAGPAIAITTQVAELSLDISADLLVTDQATVAALIQRLGRLNRYGLSRWKMFYILEVDNPRPYTQDEMDESASWLEVLGHRPLSQVDLIEAWESLPQPPPPATIPRGSALFDGICTTEKGKTRDSEGYMRTIILPDDVDKVNSKELAVREAVISMFIPRHKAFKDIDNWDSVGYYKVPPANLISYDERTGARWNL